MTTTRAPSSVATTSPANAISDGATSPSGCSATGAGARWVARIAGGMKMRRRIRSGATGAGDHDGGLAGGDQGFAGRERGGARGVPLRQRADVAVDERLLDERAHARFRDRRGGTIA